MGCRDSAGSSPRCSTAARSRPRTSRAILQPFVGHRMAKAGLELAVLDAALRAEGRPLGEYLGAVHDRVPSGVIGRHPARSRRARRGRPAATSTRGTCASRSRSSPAATSPRPPPCATRSARIPLQVDANSAYTLADIDTLAELDRFDLLLIEQPLQEDDIVDHATLARHLRTPVCLDESIVSLKAATDALALGAASVINIKAGRVGGYLEAVAIHDLCRDAGDPGVVRRHARDRHRPRGERRARGPSGLHAPGRRVGVEPVLPPRHRDRARRARGRSRARADRPRARRRDRPGRARGLHGRAGDSCGGERRAAAHRAARRARRARPRAGAAAPRAAAGCRRRSAAGRDRRCPTGSRSRSCSCGPMSPRARRRSRCVNGTDERARRSDRVAVDDPRFAGPAVRVVDRESRHPRRAHRRHPGAAARRRLRRCGASGCRSRGTVTLDVLDRRRPVEATAPLPDPLGFSPPLHERECRAPALAEAADLTFTVVRRRRRAGVPADLELLDRADRRGRRAVIRGIQTTNLLTFGAGGRRHVDTYPLDLAVTAADTAPVVVSLPLVPLRCDPHAVQEDKRGTVFTLEVELDGEPGAIEVAAPEDMRGQILTWVADWCGFGGWLDRSLSRRSLRACRCAALRRPASHRLRQARDAMAPLASAGTADSTARQIPCAPRTCGTYAVRMAPGRRSASAHPTRSSTSGSLRRSLTVGAVLAAALVLLTGCFGSDAEPDTAATATSPTTAARTSSSRPRPRRSTCSTRSPTAFKESPRARRRSTTCATVRPINVSSGEATRILTAGRRLAGREHAALADAVVAGLDGVDRARRGRGIPGPRRRAGVVHPHAGRLRRARDDGARARLARRRDRHHRLRASCAPTRRAGGASASRCGARSRSRRPTRTRRRPGSRRSSCSRTRPPARPPTSRPTTSPPPRTSRACSRSASSTTATRPARCSRPCTTRPRTARAAPATSRPSRSRRPRSSTTTRATPTRTRSSPARR